MGLARYFVFRAGDRWVVVLDGTPVGRHGTRAEALNSAIVMADLMGSMKHDADVMIEGESGLDLAWMYGRDPLPAARGEPA